MTTEESLELAIYALHETADPFLPLQMRDHQQAADALRALVTRHAAMRAVLKELVDDNGWWIWNPDYADIVCDYCEVSGGLDDNGEPAIDHAPDCPIARARRLLAEGGDNGTA